MQQQQRKPFDFRSNDLYHSKIGLNFHFCEEENFYGILRESSTFFWSVFYLKNNSHAKNASEKHTRLSQNAIEIQRV